MQARGYSGVGRHTFGGGPLLQPWTPERQSESTTKGSQLSLGHAGPALSKHTMRVLWQLQWRLSHWSSPVQERPFLYWGRHASPLHVATRSSRSTTYFHQLLQP